MWEIAGDRSQPYIPAVQSPPASECPVSALPSSDPLGSSRLLAAINGGFAKACELLPAEVPWPALHKPNTKNQKPKRQRRAPARFSHAQASDGDTGQSPNLDKIPHSPGHGFWLVRVGARVRTQSIGQLREGPEQSLGARIHDVRSLPRVRQHSPFATGHSPHANT